MKNTLAKTTKRTSSMTLSDERKLELHTHGSLKVLEQLISMNNININTAEIMASLPTYIRYFTDKQRVAFQAFYWRQMCIYDIYYTYGFTNVGEVERRLNSATNKYLKMLKADYGVR